MKIETSKMKIFSPVKWQKEQRRLKVKRLASSREALPVLNREEIIAYRLPFHEALIRKMKLNGLDNSSEYIKQLIDFQNDYRNAAGQDSIIWQRPRLMDRQDVLQRLANGLQKAEYAHYLFHTDDEIDEILKLAVRYCFGSENWWWLGHQLLYLVLGCSEGYTKDRGKRKSLVKYTCGRFLFYNAKEPEMALVHLKTARTISAVMSWKVNSLFELQQKTIFQESCEIIAKIRIIQAKASIMQKDPVAALKYAEMAKIRAMEGCFTDGIAEAYLVKGNAQMMLTETKEAIKSFYRGLEVVEKHINVDLKCELLKNVALAYLKEGIFDEALRTLKELKRYSQDHIRILYITQAHKFLGEFYLKAGTANKATPYLMAAVKLFAKLGLVSETARTRNLAAISIGVGMLPVFTVMIRDSDPKFSPNHAEYVKSLVGWKDARDSFWVQGHLSSLSLISIQSIESLRNEQELHTDKVASNLEYVPEESVLDVQHLKNSELTSSFTTQEYSIPTNVDPSTNTIFPPSTTTENSTILTSSSRMKNVSY